MALPKTRPKATGHNGTSEPEVSTSLPRRFQLAQEEATEVPEAFDDRPSSTRGAWLRLVVYGAIGLALGWLIAMNGGIPGLGLPIPGVFMAADIALPALFAVLLSSGALVLKHHIRDPELRDSATTIPKATEWGIVLFWVAWTLTNVPQLAFGLPGGLIAYALIGTRLRLKRAGFPGYGPGLTLSLLVLAFYVPWMLFRQVAHSVLGSGALGPLAPFDLVSLGYGAFAAVFVMRAAGRVGKKADRMERKVGLVDTSKTRQKESEQRTLAAVVISYLVFRFFVSDQIPYGPIVEWFLICGGILFFAIVVANRIGVVPTALALPRPEVRRHVQVVSNLPDQRLAETQTLIDDYVTRGTDAAEVARLVRTLYEESGVPAERTDAAVQRIHAHSDRSQRAKAVMDALDALRARRDTTGTLKTDLGVRTRRATERPTAH
ncbi:MAG: hypothetical protein KY455_07440 [Euryarchaeota archaeon]|nr:hypothetical protein [Euryarchaeota archaeon]